MNAEIEWVPGDWGTVKAGDKVRVNCADGTLTGKISYVGMDIFDITLDVGGYPFALSADVWDLFVPASPKVELPTEPGYYLDRMSRCWSLEQTPFEVDNVWRFGGQSYVRNAAEFAPFTRLESRADTAKAVLEFILNRPAYESTGTSVDAAAAEFGVTL